MTYDWRAITEGEAKDTLVGYQISGHNYDMSLTGSLKEYTSGEIAYKTVISGVELFLNSSGVIQRAYPSNAKIPGTDTNWVGQTLKAVTTYMGDEASVGGDVTRSRGSSGQGQSDVADISTMEPRDHFAMNALNAMMVHMKNTEAKDDATILMYSRAAYKWAQAMMIAAADSRNGQADPSQSQPSVTVNSGDLQSNTEKVLYNINESLKDVKNQISTSLSGTLKVDNPSSDSFDVAVSGGGGGGGSTFDGEITAMPNLAGTINIGSTGLGSSSSPLFNKVKIGSDEVASNNPLYVGLSSNGYGCDPNHPLHVSGGTFPSRQALAAEFNYATMHDLVTFNSAGAVGYTSKANLKDGILDDVTTSILNLATSLLDANVKLTYTEEDGVYSFTSSIVKRLYCERADFKNTETDSMIGTIINKKFGGSGREFNPIFKILKVGANNGTYWYFYTYRISYMGSLYYACYNAATDAIGLSSEPAGQEETLSAQLASVVADTLGVTFSNADGYFGNSTVAGEDVKYRIDI